MSWWELMPFLLAPHEVNGLQPLRHGQVAVFEDGPDADGELLTAVAALLQADAGLAQVIDAIQSAAVRAGRRAGPNDAFDKREGGRFIVEVLFRQDRHGGWLSDQPKLPHPVGLSKA